LLIGFLINSGFEKARSATFEDLIVAICFSLKTSEKEKGARIKLIAVEAIFDP